MENLMKSLVLKETDFKFACPEKICHTWAVDFITTLRFFKIFVDNIITALITCSGSCLLAWSTRCTAACPVTPC